VNEITKDPIKQQEVDKKMKAYSVVFPEAKEIVSDDKLMETAKEVKLGDLSKAFSKVKINEVNTASDANGNSLGYIVVVTTKEGYNPPISLAIGYTNDGIVKGLEFITFNESKNVDKLKKEYKPQFIGATAKEFAFEAGSDVTQINAVSGATVSSKAILNAVNAGIGFLNEYAKDLGGGANE
jgi:electron transport complex protein RnfG